jgi:hypothetical protein
MNAGLAKPILGNLVYSKASRMGLCAFCNAQSDVSACSRRDRLLVWKLQGCRLVGVDWMKAWHRSTSADDPKADIGQHLSR